MDLGIDGKRALVLASSRGLGLASAEALAAEGVDVLLCGRSTEQLANNASAINARGCGTASTVSCDLAAGNALPTLIEAAQRNLGGVDILINNTGGPPPGSVADATPALLRQYFETMVATLIELSRQLLPAMQERQWGRIITIASSGVVQPIPGLALSNILRSALVGWTKSLSNEVAGQGVTVNLLLPGRIHTERVDQLDVAAAARSGQSLDEVRKAARAAIPAGRYGTVAEFGAIAAMLSSVPASYITGSLIRCDGGAIRCV